ncbi:MBL fold metallo-hydrolase [uncultured Parolsenella sp.]|uniref:ComEC/Rec2 family competence protein n=1 Tax=uncultured Parolsenella sp. TaxID=2083008 RepID=UPI0025DA6863|nr:MBL fold metallo-hydrolase [uncultured Parolsenella sp.]
MASSTAAATTQPATTPATVATGGAATAAAPAPGNLVVRFVDVGQGDASIIEFPDGKTMLIDTPKGEAGTVKSQLAADSRATIDWLVATHPDADHIGGLDTIISTMDVQSVWAPEVNSSTKTYTRFLTVIANKGLQIEPCYAGRTICLGDGYTAELLWPEQGASYTEDNAYSAIIKITYGNSTFLFTGDAPAEAQRLCGAGHVDVLKVSHHGSASGMDAELASELTPSAAVISYGQNNYGHPTQVVLDALASVGTHVYGTRANGTVTAVSDGSTVSVTSERGGNVEAASQDAGKGGRSVGRED